MPPRRGCEPGKWMKCAFMHSGQGLFHKQLGIRKGTKIPVMLLRAIVKTRNGHICYNPTLSGHDEIRVTRLIKHRATLLLNADMANK